MINPSNEFSDPFTPDSESPKQKRLVLHVDDDPDFLRLIRVKLGKQGIEVVSEPDPRQAIKVRRECGAQIVLMDVNMPWIDGITLLDEMKQQDGGTQIIMLTGLVSLSTVLESMRKGAEACIFKPLDTYDELLSVVDACIEKSERWWHSLQDLCDRRNQPQPSPFAELTR